MFKRRISYHEYIQSDEWRMKEEAAKKAAGYRCQVCNTSRHEVSLDAHHRSYANLGDEKPDDITVLCRSCHELFSNHGKVQDPKRIKEADFVAILNSFWGRMFFEYGVSMENVGRWRRYETEKGIARELTCGDWKQFDRLMKVVIGRLPKLEEYEEVEDGRF